MVIRGIKQEYTFLNMSGLPMQTKGVILDDLSALDEVSCFKKPFLCCGGSFRNTKAFEYLNEKYDLTVWDKIR